MKSENLVLLPTTEYGTPSGNYDGTSTSFAGDRVKGVGYYKSSSNSQTVRFIVDEYVGTITIQASLDEDPVIDSDWFDVYEFPGDSAQDGSTAISADFSTSPQGKFTWIRAKVDGFLGGTVNSVTLRY